MKTLKTTLLILPLLLGYQVYAQTNSYKGAVVTRSINLPSVSAKKNIDIFLEYVVDYLNARIDYRVMPEVKGAIRSLINVNLHADGSVAWEVLCQDKEATKAELERILSQLTYIKFKDDDGTIYIGRLLFSVIIDTTNSN